LKIPIKRAGGVAQGEGPEFKPQYHKKKKKAKEVVGTEVPKWAQKLKQALVRV
jgi:hypothetical protein